LEEQALSAGPGYEGAWTTQQLFLYWVQNQIRDVEVRGGSNVAGSLIQLIISRDGRMAGVGFNAELIDEQWFPYVVKTHQKIWSQRYDEPWTELLVLFVILTILDAVHEFHDIAFDMRRLSLMASGASVRVEPALFAFKRHF
jgi:hypothetical protein